MPRPNGTPVIPARRRRLRLGSCLVGVALSCSGLAWPNDTGSIHAADLQVSTAPWLRSALAFRDRTVPREPGDLAVSPGRDPSRVSWRKSQGSDLLRRLSLNLDRLGTSSQLFFDRVLPNQLADEAMTPALEKSVNRATRRTLESLILRVTHVEERLDSIQDHVVDGRRGSGGDDSHGIHVRFGVSHLAPKLEIRCPMASGSMRVSLGALGQVGVDLTRARAKRAQLHGGYDHRTRTYDVFCGLRF